MKYEGTVITTTLLRFDYLVYNFGNYTMIFFTEPGLSAAAPTPFDNPQTARHVVIAAVVTQIPSYIILLIFSLSSSACWKLHLSLIFTAPVEGRMYMLKKAVKMNS